MPPYMLPNSIQSCSCFRLVRAIWLNGFLSALKFGSSVWFLACESLKPKTKTKKINQRILRESISCYVCIRHMLVDRSASRKPRSSERGASFMDIFLIEYRLIQGKPELSCEQ